MQELKDTIKKLQDALGSVVAEAQRMNTTNDIPSICAFYKSIYETLDLFEQQVAILQNVKEEYSKKVMPPLFQAMDAISITAAGKLFVLNPDFHASMPQAKQEKGLPWLKSIGYDSIVKEGVNAQTLTSAMREYIKDKGVLPPDDVMTIHIGHYISMRKKGK